MLRDAHVLECLLQCQALSCPAEVPSAVQLSECIVRVSKAVTPRSDSSPTSDPVSIVAYLPEWRYEGANWETISEHSTHLLLFSLEMEPNGRITAHDRFPRKDRDGESLCLRRQFFQLTVSIELFDQAREATRRHGTALMVCWPLSPWHPRAMG
eukprot:s72_g22.t1